MTFEEQAAELHRLEAVALSLGISSEAFERIAMEVTSQARIDGASPEEQLAEIRCRINAQARRGAARELSEHNTP